MDKADLRFAVKSRLSGMSAADRGRESRCVRRRLKEILPRDPCVICGYYPLVFEVDILPLLKEMLDGGYRLYLPRFEKGSLAFRRVTGFAALTPGELAIPEPPADAPAPDVSEKLHVLVPGRAFDKSGNRLGRGNGGYDRWIADNRAMNVDMALIGVCFECQIVRGIPMEAHDRKVDKVVTARGVAG